MYAAFVKTLSDTLMPIGLFQTVEAALLHVNNYSVHRTGRAPQDWVTLADAGDIRVMTATCSGYDFFIQQFKPQVG